MGLALTIAGGVVACRCRRSQDTPRTQPHRHRQESESVGAECYDDDGTSRCLGAADIAVSLRYRSYALIGSESWSAGNSERS